MGSLSVSDWYNRSPHTLGIVLRIQRILYTHSLFVSGLPATFLTLVSQHFALLPPTVPTFHEAIKMEIGSPFMHIHPH